MHVLENLYCTFDIQSMINARLIYTPENLQKAFSVHTRKVFPVRGRILLYLGLLLVWTGLLLWLINFTQQVKPAYLFYIVAGLIFIGVHFITLKNLGKQAFKQLKHRASLEYHFAFNDTGLTIQAQNTQQFFEWGNIQKAVLLKDIVMLYPSKQMFYFVQEGNITEGSFSELHNLVQSKVSTILK